LQRLQDELRFLRGQVMAESNIERALIKKEMDINNRQVNQARIQPHLRSASNRWSLQSRTPAESFQRRDRP
jgi:hypothetical protein